MKKAKEVKKNYLLANENASLTTEDSLSTINNKQPDLKLRSSLREDSCSPMVDRVGKLDELDTQILTLAKEQYHPRFIAKTLNRSQSTIRYRLDRLEKKGMVSKVPGVHGTILYLLNSKSSELLIHNEKQPLITPFTAHCMSFKFPILKGNQPKSSNVQEMKNWKSFTFKFPTHTIRTTTKNIIVFVNQDLGTGSVNNLNLKYGELALSYAHKFAKQHNISIGSIDEYRKGHYTIKDSAFGQILAERGEFRTQSGIMIDKSKSEGDVEMSETSARSFEYTLNKLPIITAGLQGEMRDVALKVEALSSVITDIQASMQLDRKNSQMFSQMEKAVEKLSVQATELKSQIDREEKSNSDNNVDRMYA